MPFSKVFVVVSGQINQRKARGMKIGEVCAGGRNWKYSARKSRRLKRCIKNILSRFKRLIVAACFDKRLFRQKSARPYSMFPAGFLQMPVRIHANQETEPNAGADQRHKAAAIDAVLQFLRSRRFPPSALRFG